MPIYDQRYKRWEGQLYPRGIRWLIIAQDSIRRPLQGKAIRFCFLLALIPFLVWVVRIYISVNWDLLAEQFPFMRGELREMLANIGPPFYYDFLRMELSLVFFVIFIAGSSLIADDRRHNALSLYLSRPLTRVDYLLGKAAGVGVPIACLTLIPCLLLYLLHGLFRNDWLLLFRDAQILMAIVLQSLLLIVSGSLIILAISSCTKQGRYATFGFIGLVIGGRILVETLRAALSGTSIWGFSLGSPRVRLLSLWDDWDRLGVAIFDVERFGSSYRGWGEFDWPWALLGIGLFVGFSLWILRRQIRGMDIVR